MPTRLSHRDGISGWNKLMPPIARSWSEASISVRFDDHPLAQLCRAPGLFGKGAPRLASGSDTAADQRASRILASERAGGLIGECRDAELRQSP